MWTVNKDISKLTIVSLTSTEANLHRMSSSIAYGSGFFLGGGGGRGIFKDIQEVKCAVTLRL